MAQQVNLDALIPREDFEIMDTDSPSLSTQTVQIRNLEQGDFFYGVIRKPDFQRETNEWAPRKITDFINSFLSGDLIPVIILWQSGSQIFVIDGAHRLSALIAWVNDDYGDGNISKLFFDGVIPQEQIAVAEQTRKSVNKSIGKYSDYKLAMSHPEKVRNDVVTGARRLGRLAMQLQWVNGDASKAEDSFFKINQQASPIDRTEIRLLKSRKLPNALAARAIVRSGTGHKYWSRFDSEKVEQIENKAKIINNILFSPELRTPIKTLDLPVAGRGYSAQTLSLVFEFVNLSNNIKSNNQVNDVPLSVDSDGEATLRYVNRCLKIANRISGIHASSLGLHPAVYFYSQTGRYQPTAFLAMVSLIQYMERKNMFSKFIDIRSAFEMFMIKYRILVNQTTVKYGSGPKGFERLREMYEFIIGRLMDGKDEQTIIGDLAKHDDLSFLQPKEIYTPGVGKDFGTGTKSAVFIK